MEIGNCGHDPVQRAADVCVAGDCSNGARVELRVGGEVTRRMIAMMFGEDVLDERQNYLLVRRHLRRLAMVAWSALRGGSAASGGQSAGEGCGGQDRAQCDSAAVPREGPRDALPHLCRDARERCLLACHVLVCSLLRWWLVRA